MTFPTGNESTGYSLFGMPVEVSDFLPDNIIMAVDPGGVEQTAIVDVKCGTVSMVQTPVFDDADLNAAIKKAAARIQEDIYAPIFGGVTTTSNIPDDPLDLTKMMHILDQARTARLEQDKKLVGALLDCGFQIVCNEFAYRPHALLPIEFQDALTAVLEERKRRVL
jgi:hypothetical protein